jgi:polyisoprenoid-binding protein YceI
MKQIFYATTAVALMVFQALAADLPAGSYTLDKSHASLLFRVNHMGFSNYTARFKRFDAKLQIDPANPGAAKLEATIDVTSLETDFPTPKVVDFNAELQNDQWLNAAKFPQMTFRSTKVDLTSPKTARVSGDLALHGITKPVVLDVTFNGGYPGMAGFDPNARIGFSAKGAVKRSGFGVANGIPAPGSNMGVSDNVDIIIEAEFTGPALPPAKAK